MSKIPFVIYSFNREYRDLVRFLGQQLVLLVRMFLFRFGPLEVPPNVDCRQYLSSFATVLTQTSSLLVASRGVLMIMLAGLFNQYMPWVTRVFPALEDLLRFARNFDVHPLSAAFQCKGRIVDRLESLLAMTGDLFKCSAGFPIQRLMETNVVYEVDGFCPEHEAFIVLSQLNWVFSFLLANTPLEQGLRYVIVVDEAQRLLDRSAQSRVAEGVPLFSTQIAQFRKTGCAVIVAAQLPSRLLEGVIENCARKVVFNLGSGEDIRTAASSLQLTPRQTELLSRLEVGQAVVRDPRYPEPFVIRAILFKP